MLVIKTLKIGVVRTSNHGIDVGWGHFHEKLLRVRPDLAEGASFDKLLHTGPIPSELFQSFDKPVMLGPGPSAGNFLGRGVGA